jgi:hypothetical protein
MHLGAASFADALVGVQTRMSLAVSRTQGMGAFRFAFIINFGTTVCLCPEHENESGVIAYLNDEVGKQAGRQE